MLHPNATFATILLALLCLGSCSSREPVTSPKPEPLKPILLTGFGPFGDYGENPSWQAVSQLDGETINGHPIVVQKLEVVWGMPLPAVEAAIEMHRPVAVISFGVGNPGAFTVESLGRNARQRMPDASGKAPTRLTVLKGGPDHYKTSTNASAVVKKLEEKGHVVVQSYDAGQYLCEECLYSLEHIRATKFPKIRVMFCHVPPPAGNFTGTDKPITLESIVEFMRDVTAALAASTE